MRPSSRRTKARQRSKLSTFSWRWWTPVTDRVGEVLTAAGITTSEIRAARNRAFQAALALVGVHTERAAPSGSRRLRRGRSTPFAPSAKLALERTLDLALASGDRRITNEHLLNAIASAEVGSTPWLLAELGTTPEQLRAALRKRD